MISYTQVLQMTCSVFFVCLFFVAPLESCSVRVHIWFGLCAFSARRVREEIIWCALPPIGEFRKPQQKDLGRAIITISAAEVLIQTPGCLSSNIEIT